MSTTNHQKLKLLYLMRMLQEETDSEHGLTMADILERLEAEGIAAERKSIYRDIQALRDFGLDVQTYKRHPVEYALVKSELELSDIMMLVDAVQSSRFLTERKSGQLVKSLKGLASERERKLLDKRVHVQGRIKSQNESVFHNVDAIHLALQQKRKVQFMYFKYGTDLKRRSKRDGKQYVETPVSVVYADGMYYLVAFNDKHDKFVTYRIDRMQLLQVSDEPATRNARIANYAFEDFEYQTFGMFDGEPVTVTLSVDAKLVDAAVDKFGNDVPIAKAGEKAVEVRVPVRVSPQFFGWVAGMDGGVRICAPKRVAADYRAWLMRLAEQ